MRIGIDIMGSDRSPYSLFEALQLLAQHLTNPPFFKVFATEEVAQNIKMAGCFGSEIDFDLTSTQISMDDDPFHAIVKKQEASMLKGLRALKTEEIDAFVTAGNTGALMVASKFYLRMIPPFKRPALLATLPSHKNALVVLDVGANLLCKANHLVQDALMGAIYLKTRYGLSNPKVALLNVGSEVSKGSAEHRKAFEELTRLSKESKINFIGNIEGHEVFKGTVDLVVTDGFSGNVFLKTAEGTSNYLIDYFEQLFSEKHLKDEFSEIRLRFKNLSDSGALLMGVDGIVMKCHGNASQDSFKNGIVEAIELLKMNFLPSFKHTVCSML